jgi:hypothetical protein
VLAGRESEAAVVPVEPWDNTTCGDGKGRCFVGAHSCRGAQRVLIPKPGTGEMRPPSIPAVRDRIVQAALKIVLEPVFEAGFLPCSFGFRPRLSAHDALQVPVEECARGRRWVVETDIASCFSAIPHEGLMEAVEFPQSAATVTSTPPTARQHIRQAPR